MRFKLAFKFIGFFGFLSIPHILNKLGANPTIFIPWDQVAKEFWENTEHHLLSLGTTFYNGAIAIIVSILLGISIGIIISYYNRWVGFFETVMKFIWSIPLIIVAVYLNIFIDIHMLYIVITGVFLGVFPILSFTYRKGIEADEGILSLVASFNLSKKDEFLYFRFREITRNLTIPLAQSVPLTFIGITMGEYVVGRAAGTVEYGLGIDFRNAMEYSRFEKVYVAIILMVFLVFLSGEIFDSIANIKSFFRNFKNRISSKGKE